MPDQTSGWTIETLAVYLSQRIADNDRLYIQRFDSAEHAVMTATVAIEKRLEGLNELRAMASDSQRLSIPRLEQESMNKVFTDKLAAHERRLDQALGSKTGSREFFAYAVGIVGIILTVIAFFLKGA